jgi:formate-nitrite transporter family protein
MKSIKETLTQPKEVHEILNQLTEEGEIQHKRSSKSLFLSSFGAGLEISFSVLLIGVVYTLYNHQVSEASMHMLLSISYPLGFLFVILGKSELFTEHTTVAVLPTLAGRTSFISLLRIWAIVLIANLVGVFVFCCILAVLPTNMEIIKPEAYEHVAMQILSYKWYNIGGSAVLAGWLMGLLGWLVTSATDTISRILIIILVTFVIGAAGLHHSIVGAAEVITGWLTSPNIHFKDFIRFMAVAVPGNIIGGSIFVAALKKSHTKEEDFDTR